jgi:hypothetical protein
MNSSELLTIFESLPEIELFRDCAERSHMSFGLTGSVLRNIVLAKTGRREQFDTLYSFVDAFGDIDIIISDETHQGCLAQALFTSVPFADCHSWDFRTESEAARASTRHGLVAADLLILWFDEKRGLSLRTLGQDVEAILDRPLQPQRTIAQVVARADTPFQFLQTIKYARIGLEFLEQDAPAEREFYKLIDGWQKSLQFLNLPSSPPLWRGIIPRLEIELAQLLLDTANWSTACAFVNRVGSVVPREWHKESRALGMLLRPELERSTRIGASLYRSRPRARWRFSVITEDSGEEEARISHQSRIPWTGLELSGTNPPSCCRYADFEEGIAVIAWRNSSPNRTLEDERLEPKEYGLVAGPATPAQREVDLSNVDNLIPISGYTRRGRSITVRIDPAYLKLVTAGRQSRFLIGLVPVSSFEDSESSKQTEPRGLNPESEKRRRREAAETKKKKKPAEGATRSDV